MSAGRGWSKTRTGVRVRPSRLRRCAARRNLVRARRDAPVFTRFVPVQVRLVEPITIQVSRPMIYELRARMNENVVTT